MVTGTKKLYHRASERVLFLCSHMRDRHKRYLRSKINGKPLNGLIKILHCNIKIQKGNKIKKA